MASATFEEKSYELAYCVELASGAAGGVPVFAPGQVLERVLGFDASATPGSSHVVWQVLSLPRPPGVSMSPGLWFGGRIPSSSSLPRYPVSLFLQFKRPEYLCGGRAKQWRLWYAPYYRFTRTSHQQQVLARLERNLGSKAAVRYAAPAFHTVSELEAAQLAGTVIARSGHVPPQQMTGHRVWTYQRPGTYGRANADGKASLFESFNAIIESLDERNGERTEVEPWLGEPVGALRAHLADVAEVCRHREPAVRQAVDRWSRGLAELDLDAETTAAVRDFASIQSVMARESTRWWVTGLG